MRRSILDRIALVCAVAVLAASCSGCIENPYRSSNGTIPRYSVSGRVFREGSGAGLAGVLVAAPPFGTTETDSQGEFTKTGLMPLAGGPCWLYPAKAGYLFEPYRSSVDYPSPCTADFRAWPRQNGSLLALTMMDSADYAALLLTANPDGRGMSRALALDGYWYADEMSLSWSPTQDAIAFALKQDIWIADLVTGGVYRVTRNAHRNSGPSWSPTQDLIAFSSATFPDQYGYYSSSLDLYTVEPSGACTRRITFNDLDCLDPCWSPDGTRIAYAAHPAPGVSPRTYSIRVVDTVTGADVELANMQGQCSNPDWSPDGTQIAFAAATDSTHTGLWVMPADGSSPRRQIDMPDLANVYDPSWSSDGLRIAVVVQTLDNESLVGSCSVRVVDPTTGQYDDLTSLGTRIVRMDW